MKIAVVSSGFLPIPATKGGAVESLVENLLKKNEEYKKLDIELFGIFDENAYEKSKKYNNTHFTFIKLSKFVKFVDSCLYFFAKNVLKKENSHSYKFVFQRISYLRKVSKHLKNNNYDKVILENHVTQYMVFKWHKNLKKYENKIYYHCHNEVNNLYHCDKIVSKTVKFICISEYIRNFLIEKYDYINEKNTAVLKNSIDIEKFNRKINVNEVKEKYGIATDRQIILYTGRLVEEKGILKLITALKYLENIKFQLVIVGGVVSKINFETTFTKKLKEQCKKYEDKILFTGYVDNSNINELYKVADVVVLPSIWEEPAGLTMLESIAAGAALITTDVGGIHEYVGDNNAILLKNDISLEKNIGESIKNILENYDLKKQISKNGYENSREYNLDNYYTNFCGIIEKIREE